jgi:hypothetical protein
VESCLGTEHDFFRIFSSAMSNMKLKSKYVTPTNQRRVARPESPTKVNSEEPSKPSMLPKIQSKKIKT